jgi:hypothetical protein
MGRDIERENKQVVVGLVMNSQTICDVEVSTRIIGLKR